MASDKKRVPLYRRLPEIYRIKDEDLPNLYLEDGVPVEAFQLRSYLEPVEDMFSAIHENIESLYHDFFIEHSDEWVIPYIADLLGTSHLSGDEWTLRADVAGTIALRRRKGTLGAIELLAFILTKWGVHSVELLENMVWNQHLNHQRPDAGGVPPYSLPTVRAATPRRGGTVSLRDPSLLAQLNTPFDPFAHVADVSPHETGQVRYNLPNLAIYLWRLKAFRLDVTKPHMLKMPPAAAGAPHVVRINVDPVPLNDLSNDYVKPANTPGGRPVTLFNTNRYALFVDDHRQANGLDLSEISPRISTADQVPGPIPRARISDYDIADAYDADLAAPPALPLKFYTDQSFTAPQEYFSLETYDATAATLATLEIADQGLQMHLPEATFPGSIWPHTATPRHWKIRGENLCAWEIGLVPPLADKEIAIDPVTGRICVGVSSDARADALLANLLLTYTYGAPGEVGAHPISYPALPPELDHNVSAVFYREVSLKADPDGLKKALAGISARNIPTVIVINDSRTHVLDLGDALLAGDVISESGFVSLVLNAPLVIRAADGQRPIIELTRPLAFRPKNVSSSDAATQKQYDAVMDGLFVRLEGLYLARNAGFAAGAPLIARAALNRLEILSCTVDPGGFTRFNGDRAPLLKGLNLTADYGFGAPNPNAAAELAAFKQTPEIVVQRTVTGAIFTDEGYRLCLSDSIVESMPVGAASFAITGAAAPATGYAGKATFENVTILGRVRIFSADGQGAIFKGILQVYDQQSGCLKYCYFADDDIPGSPKNRLPQNFACVNGKTARLVFTSESFGNQAYCQLSLECDPRILEEGPGSDQMGAYNFLKEAHKWRNLKIRFREFMPVGVKPLLIPVT